MVCLQFSPKQQQINHGNIAVNCSNINTEVLLGIFLQSIAKTQDVVLHEMRESLQCEMRDMLILVKGVI